jgi:transcriptional regulator with XRE-family HTH domain
MKFQMFTEKTCFVQIRADFDAAQHIIVLQTPYLTAAGIKRETRAISRALSRGVIFIVAFQAPNNWERRADPSLPADEKLDMQKTQDAVTWLLAHGAIPVALDKAHQKLMTFDRKIVWDGTMNLLSWYNTHEHWNRTESPAKVREIERMHHIDPLYLLDLARQQGVLKCDQVKDSQTDRQDIANLVRTSRALQKLTQAQLAVRVGASRDTVRAIESGADYSLSHLFPITAFFGCFYLLGRSTHAELRRIRSAEDYFQLLGQQIARRRISLGLSQREFVKLLGVTQAYVSKLERGQICAMHTTLHKICDALYWESALLMRK